MTTTLLLPLLAVLSPARLSQAPCTAADVMHYVSTIAADSMLGRSPGSRGDSLSTAFLERALLEATGRTGSVTLQGVPVGATSHSRNVIATIPGRGDEWIVVSAHHDGLGIGKPDARGDSIYNGANDNAVGVAVAICALRNIAQADANRGIIVILTAAEERGHVGARYWTEHPTVPLAKVRFAVNLDALGVTGPTQDFIAYGNMLLAGADSLLRAAGDAAGFELSTVSFESSMLSGFDSAEFAAAGVPAITIGQGSHFADGPRTPPPAGMPTLRQRYHAPSDEVAGDWNAQAILRFSELATAVVNAARSSTQEIQLKAKAPF